MKGEAREIGFDVKAPKTKCDDDRCPFHGKNGVKLRGRTFVGTVVSDKMHRSVIVEWGRQVYVPKYERHRKKKTKVTAHNPPCINAREGDEVMIVECRPMSKSKNYVVVQDMGKVKGYEERKEALEESKVKDKKKEKEEDAEEAKTEPLKAKEEKKTEESPVQQGEVKEDSEQK